MSRLGERGALTPPTPTAGGSGGEEPVDRFLADLSIVEFAARDHPRMISRVDLTTTLGSVQVTEVPQEGNEHWFGPFPFTADRVALSEGLIRPSRLPEPSEWEVMSHIPYGSDLGWREHWAALLVDAASYGWALRGEHSGLRYDRIELRQQPHPSHGGGQAAVTVVHEAQPERRWITLIPIPVPQAVGMDVVGLGFKLREWITAGEGESLQDGSVVMRLQASA